VAGGANTVFSASRSIVVVPILPTDKLVFASDIEGNYDYFRKFVDSCPAFTCSTSPLHLNNCHGKLHGCNLTLNPNYLFVFVGDVGDRGNGDCRLLYDLVFLKETYPTRVYLILGNRDMNKLRFTTELDPEIVQLDVHPSVFWHKSTPLTPWPSRIDKLKWTLSENMGSPDSFEHRKSELSLLFDSDSIGDDDVLQSYMDLVDPKYIQQNRGGLASSVSLKASSSSSSSATIAYADSNAATAVESHVMIEYSRTFGGLLLRYLMGASIGILIGDILVVHGGVNDINMGWIPPFSRDMSPWDCSNRNNLSVGDMPQIFEGLYRFKVFDNSAPVAKSRKRDYRQELIDWLQEMEDFKINEVNDFINNTRNYIDFYVQQTKSLLARGESGAARLWSKIGTHFHYQPGSRLLAYGMSVNTPEPGNENRINAGVIYTSYIYAPNSSKDPARPNMIDANTRQFLEVSGISRVVVGHQPIGDMPLVINNGRVQVVCLDTSYSINVKWKLEDLAVGVTRTSDTSVTDMFISIPSAGDPSFGPAPPQHVIDMINQSSSKSRSRSSSGSSNTTTTASTYSMKEISADYDVNSKNTRGYSVSHVEASFATDSDGKVISRDCLICGRLSNGQMYVHKLFNPSISLYDPTRSNSNINSSTSSFGGSGEEEDLAHRLSKLIGMQTKSGGWILRSYGVLDEYSYSSTSTSGATLLLFSYTSGFNVYNRLVSNIELAAAGISLDAPSRLGMGFKSIESCFELLPK
jgi:hypothetical protein